MTVTMSASDARTFDRFSAINAATVEAALPCGCRAYEDVFTFRRWIAQGYAVRKGEHGVKIATYAPITRKSEETGETEIVGRRPWRSAVFCRHQVDSRTCDIIGHDHTPAQCPEVPA